MKKDSINEYEYLWTANGLERYVLARMENTKDQLDYYLICDLSTKTTLIIEDNAVYLEVIERMKRSGAKEFVGIPWKKA